MATVSAVPLPPDQAKRLNAVGHKARKAMAERDAEVVAAVRAGGSLREVGALVGLSHGGVQRILDRADPEES